MCQKKSKPSLDQDWSGGAGILPGREAFGPLFLMAVTPCFSIIFYHVCSFWNGDFRRFALSVLADKRSFFDQLYSIWPDPWDKTTWQMIGSFLVFQLVIMRVLPGRRFEATITPTGHRPVYKDNGMLAYISTLAVLVALDFWDIFPMARVYDKFGNILSSMNVFALLFCFMLLIKGYVAPTSTDSGTTGSLITDFYWGMELYPRIAGWDVKQFTNCRAGMMFWAVAITCFCYKNMELNGGNLQVGLAVSVALQLVYISKFYYWEMGYMYVLPPFLLH
jgi:7-dehydrocholesterol reductase